MENMLNEKNTYLQINVQADLLWTHAHRDLKKIKN